MPTVFNQSLWGDEGFSAILSMRSLPEIVKIIIKDTSPPLWNFFEWLVFNTLGMDEIYIRGLAFAFFLGTVFFAYKISSHLFDRKTGLVASILVFLNPFFFTYAFEGRMYSILALGVTASMYFFLKKRWGWYIFWTLWALYSHHFAIFAVFIQGLWFLYEFLFGDRKSSSAMFKSFLFVGLGYLPWVYPLYLQASKVGGGFWLGTPSLKDLGNLINDYLAEGIKSHPYKVLGISLERMSLFVVFATIVIRRWGKKVKENLFLLSWFFIPILATWLISQKFTSIFFNRYLLYTIPAAMIPLSSLRRNKLSGILITLLAASFLVIDLHYFTNPSKIPFRDLAGYVKSTRIEGDFLINEDVGNHKLWESIYYGVPAPIYNPSGASLPYFIGTALMRNEDVVTQVPKETIRLGIVTYKSAAELKFDGFALVEEHRFGDLNFVWLKRIYAKLN